MSKEKIHEEDLQVTSVLSDEEVKSISLTLLRIIDRQNKLIENERKIITDAMKKITGGKGFFLANSKE